MSSRTLPTERAAARRWWQAPTWVWMLVLLVPPVLSLMLMLRPPAAPANVPAASPAAAPATLPELRLDAHASSIPAWPHLMLLSDPQKTMQVNDALAAAPRFVAPHSAVGTLGVRRDAVWLRVPIAVAADAPVDWILDIDYAGLNRIEAHLVTGGAARLLGRMGNLETGTARALGSRSHAVPFTVQPGGRHELLVRVETSGGMVLPITVSRPAAFHQRAVNEQMLQGLLTGIGLCLLLYSLAQWATLRETLFLKYAVLISGSLLFSLFQFGIASQYLWHDNLWAERHIGALAALIATGGSFLFIEHALSGPGTSRAFSRAMQIGAGLTMSLGIVYCLDIVDTRIVIAVISLIGPVPALMGLPGAIRLAQRGDGIGICFLLAWLVYFGSTSVMIGLINGSVHATFLNLHSFQIGATIDMLLFMRVLGLRLKAVHTAAQSASRERDAMLTLANSDPLTGLPNRRGMNEALNAAIGHAREDHMLAVFLLDLDGFKPVNDQHGHDVGDELLIAVAQRLQSTLRSSDVVARLGGDEFVVLTAGLQHPAQATELGTQMLEAFRQPFVLTQHRCSVGLTIGYALAPLDAQDAVGLLKLADAAMYAGKQSGKNCLRRGGTGASTAPATPLSAA